MKKLKIGLLSYRSDPFSGGQGIYVKNVSEALLNRGHEVTIFSGNPLPVVDERIKVVEIITPGYFETFNSLERYLSSELKVSKYPGVIISTTLILSSTTGRGLPENIVTSWPLFKSASETFFT